MAARHAAVLILLALALGGFAPAADAVRVGDTAPGFSLEDGDNKTIEFPAAAKGAPALLFFWATWCPYCKAVMPYLDRIKADYADYGFEIYAISFKDDGDPAAMMQELGYDFVVMPAGDLVADDYDVWSAPGLLLVDGDGIVTYRRKPTAPDVKPGKAIAEVWDGEIRAALEAVVATLPPKAPVAIGVN